MLNNTDVIQKILPFILSLLFLQISHYYTKGLIKSWVITVIIGIIATGISFFTFGKSIWIVLQVFIYLIFVLHFLVKEKQLRRMCLILIDNWKFRLGRLSFPNNEKIRAVFDKYDSSQGKLAWLSSDYEVVYEACVKKHGKKRPTVFLKTKLKQTTSWIHALELKFLRDLKYIGFNTFVFIYDVPIDSNMTTEISKRERVNSRKKMLGDIKKNVGCGVTIRFSSDFFKKKRNAQYLHDLFFGPHLNDYFDTYILKDVENKTCYNDGTELKFRLLGYLGRVAVDILSFRNPIWIIQWDQRTDKWKIPYNLIHTRTVKTEGKHINLNNCIQITDNSEQIESKLKGDTALLKDELIEFCALFGGIKDYKTISNSYLKEKDDIKNIVGKMSEKGFISGQKKDDIYERLSGVSQSIHSIKESLESDPIFELACLKMKSEEVLLSYKSDYGI